MRTNAVSSGFDLADLSKSAPSEKSRFLSRAGMKKRVRHYFTGFVDFSEKASGFLMGFGEKSRFWSYPEITQNPGKCGK